MRPVHVGLVSGLALWWFFACSAEPASDGGSSRATGDGGYSAGEATGGVPATGGVAVTGGAPSPDLDLTLFLVGRDASLRRIDRAIERIRAQH